MRSDFMMDVVGLLIFEPRRGHAVKGVCAYADWR